MSQQIEKPVLMIIDGELQGQKWVMHGDELTIGRGGEAVTFLGLKCPD